MSKPVIKLKSTTSIDADKPKLKIQLKPPAPIVYLPPQEPVIGFRHYPKLFQFTEGFNLYTYMRDTIAWEQGIKSRKAGRVTRLAKSMNVDTDPMIQWTIMEAFKRMGLSGYIIYGLYLNYYRDGYDFTPVHKHPGTMQLVLSFNEPGGDRILTLGSSSYRLQNGDAIVFGSQNHGIPIEDDRKGRISIATFMTYDPTIKGGLAFMS